MVPSDDDLGTVDRAWALVSASLGGLTDDQAREASRLPGWSRGHLLTHLARSADSYTRCVAGAAQGDRRPVQYPHGADGRARDIEQGAGRPAAEIVADVSDAQERLMAEFRACPDDAWSVESEMLTGTRLIAELVPSRRRELLVHLVDLDLGVEPADLPRDYLDTDAAWLAEFRPEWPR